MKDFRFGEINEDSNCYNNLLFKKNESNELSQNCIYPFKSQDSKNSIQSKNILLNNNDYNYNDSLIGLADYNTLYNQLFEDKYEKGEDFFSENEQPSEFEDELEIQICSGEDENVVVIEEKENPKFQKKLKNNIFIIDKDRNKNTRLNNNNFIGKKCGSTENECVTSKDERNLYFPFTKGKRMIFKSNNESVCFKKEYSVNRSTISSQCTSSISLVENKKKIESIQMENNIENFKEDISIEEISNIEPFCNLNDIFHFKFTTKKYFTNENGKKKRIKKKRKFKSDDIRKKIKCRFHKEIKNLINKNLKNAGSKELFDFFPQIFIGNVTKNVNEKYFDLTYKELLSIDFIEEINKSNYHNGKVDKNKYMKNIKVLKYLEKNPEISKNSGFDLIKNKKYKDILKCYFNSEEFENSLIKLKKEKESPEYIQDYIKIAKTYVSFYCNKKNNNDKYLINLNEEMKEDEKNYN